jgi:hypothetical protein
VEAMVLCSTATTSHISEAATYFVSALVEIDRASSVRSLETTNSAATDIVLWE